MRELDPNQCGMLGGEIRESRRATRERWEVRAAQWKALELAREAFGDDAAAGLAPYPARGGFRGMVRLAVPFQDLDDHRDREDRFLALAGRDALLQRVPLVFVFDPVPVSSARPEDRRTVR